jgi:hypothetical protein
MYTIFSIILLLAQQHIILWIGMHSRVPAACHDEEEEFVDQIEIKIHSLVGYTGSWIALCNPTRPFPLPLDMTAIACMVMYDILHTHRNRLPLASLLQCDSINDDMKTDP